MNDALQSPPEPLAGSDPLDSLLVAIHHSPIPQVISNPRLPDNPLIAVNAPFCALTGYAEQDILGRNCRFLAGPGTEPWLSQSIRDALQARRPVMVELLNYKADGAPFRNAVTIAPSFDGSGELAYFIGSQLEMPAETEAYFARRARAAEMVKALSKRQREILGEMAAGYRSKQIAYHLSLSEKTVKMHRSILFDRLGVSNAADAVRLAVEAGL